MHPACITYLDPEGQLMTAWVVREETQPRGYQRILIAVEPGLPAFATGGCDGGDGGGLNRSVADGESHSRP